MSRASGDDAIRFTGPPWNAKAVIDVVPSGDAVVPIRMNVAGEASIHRAYVRPFGPGRSEMRLNLPRETPPGTYRGEVSVGGKTRETVIDIEPVARVRLSPKQSSIRVEPGGRAEVAVTISNHGNVPIEVPDTGTFDLDDAAGQDRALGRSLRATLGEGERRVDRFFEELQASHGGEATVRVTGGAGRLEPGESRVVQAWVEVPMTTQPGRAYLGAWSLGTSTHLIAVEVTKPGPRDNGRKLG